MHADDSQIQTAPLDKPRKGKNESLPVESGPGAARAPFTQADRGWDSAEYDCHDAAGVNEKIKRMVPGNLGDVSGFAADAHGDQRLAVSRGHQAPRAD